MLMYGILRNCWKQPYLEIILKEGCLCVCGAVTLKTTDHNGLFEYIKEGIGME